MKMLYEKEVKQIVYLLVEFLNLKLFFCCFFLFYAAHLSPFSKVGRHQCERHRWPC